MMKKRTSAAVLATPVVIVGATFGIMHSGSRPVEQLQQIKRAAASSADPGAPGYLPSNASLSKVTRDTTSGTGAIVREYVLAGRANANIVTPQRLALTPKQVHPATVLTVYYIPGLSSPDEPIDPTYFDRVAVDVNGAAGTLSTPKTGHGAIRLDWVDAAGDYHVVATEQLITPEGLSGVSADEVVKVARSVR